MISPATALAIVQAAVAAFSPQSYCRVGDPVTPRQTWCLAMNIYHEARGEGIEGMVAVGLVTANRVRSPHYAASYCEVVFQKSQFAWTEKPPGDREVAEPVAFAQAAEIAVGIIGGRIANPGFTATHFESGPRPYWAGSLIFKGRIGRQRFYEEKQK